VRAANAFRWAGRPRRIENHRQVRSLERSGRHHLILRRYWCGRERAKSDAAWISNGPDGFERKRARIEQRQILRMGCLDYQQPCSAVRQDMLELRAARGDVNRNRDGAQPSATQENAEVFDAVGTNERDPIARANARGGKRTGKLPGSACGLGVRPCDIAGRHQGLLGVERRLACQYRRQRTLGRSERCRQLRSQPGC